MPTTVGTKDTVEDLIRNLLTLEHDAIAAYDSAIERLETSDYREQIGTFRRDHETHVADLSRIASGMGVVPPREGDMKQWLTTGKVALAGLVGDDAILKAMKTNEDDTVMAYEQALKNTVASADLRPVLEKACRTNAAIAPGWKRPVDIRRGTHEKADAQSASAFFNASNLGINAPFGDRVQWSLTACRRP